MKASDVTAQPLATHKTNRVRAGIAIALVILGTLLYTLHQYAPSSTPLLEDQRLRLVEWLVPRLRRGLDWALWILIGAASSLLIECARDHREIRRGGEPRLAASGWPRFCLDVGAALVVLILLSLIDVRRIGQEGDALLALNTDPSVPGLMLPLSFLMGFYRRVARQAFANARTRFARIVGRDRDRRTAKEWRNPL